MNNGALGYESSSINLVTKAGTLRGELFRWDEAPEDLKDVKLRLEFQGEVIEARDSSGYFQALSELRKELESRQILLACYGASLNVYPSGMISSMGLGEKAYKLHLGRPALTQDLVIIFDDGPDVVPATVKDQLEFYNKWAKSIQNLR